MLDFALDISQYLCEQDDNKKLTLYIFIEAVVLVRETIASQYRRPTYYMESEEGIEEFLKREKNNIKSAIEQLVRDYADYSEHYRKHGDAVTSLVHYYNLSESAAKISHSMVVGNWKLRLRMGRYDYGVEKSGPGPENNVSTSMYDPMRRDNQPLCKKYGLELEALMRTPYLKNLILSKTLELYNDGHGKPIYGAFVILLSNEKHFTKDDLEGLGIPSVNNLQQSSIVNTVIKNIQNNKVILEKLQDDHVHCIFALKPLYARKIDKSGKAEALFQKPDSDKNGLLSYVNVQLADKVLATVK
ncbi:hypothetical protein L596_016023 [Steinernema carpocapsae]|uniref:Uncharacterized protein n=1 Tax=Steinernema carpocapsae TaxID=34508 RepID=A0A4U5NGS3_STECR|nr:hypothetical protein L596_016023 [Steinernema carpocapsae]